MHLDSFVLACLQLVNVQGSPTTQQLGSVHLHQSPGIPDTPTTPALVVLTSVPQPNPSTVTLSGGFTALNFNKNG